MSAPSAVYNCTAQRPGHLPLVNLTKQDPTNLLTPLLTILPILDARKPAWRLPMWWLLNIQSCTRSFYLTPPPLVLTLVRLVPCPPRVWLHNRDPRSCTVPLWPLNRPWSLAPLTRTLLLLFALGLPHRQCRCILALIPPMPRFLVFFDWNKLYETWVGLIHILTELLINGAMNIEVKEATCPFRVPQGDICIR